MTASYSSLGKRMHHNGITTFISSINLHQCQVKANISMMSKIFSTLISS